jgi:hypothetical protein
VPEKKHVALRRVEKRRQECGRSTHSVLLIMATSQWSAGIPAGAFGLCL